MPGIEIAGQVIGVMAMALIVLSFQCKKRAGFYVMQMSGNVLFAVSFLMLGNVGASLMNLMGVFRAIILLLPERRRKIWHLVLINLLSAVLCLRARSAVTAGHVLFPLPRKLRVRSVCGTAATARFAGYSFVSSLPCGSPTTRCLPRRLPSAALSARRSA